MYKCNITFFVHVFNLQTEAKQIKPARPRCKKQNKWNNNCWVLNKQYKCKVANIIMIYWAPVTSGHYVPVYWHFSVCFCRSDSTERPSYRTFPRSEWRPSTGPSIKHRPQQDGDIMVPPEKLQRVSGLSVCSGAPCVLLGVQKYLLISLTWLSRAIYRHLVLWRLFLPG